MILGDGEEFGESEILDNQKLTNAVYLLGRVENVLVRNEGF